MDGLSDSDDAPGDGAFLRVAARESMMLMATIRPATGGAALTIRVRNLSATGLMGECEQDLARDEHLTVTLRGVGDVDGVVAWTGNGRFGFAFERRIDPRATRKPVAPSGVTPRLLVGSGGSRPGFR